MGLKTKKKEFFLFLPYLFFSNLLIFEISIFKGLNLFNMEPSPFKRYVILSFLSLGSLLYFLKEFIKT